MIEKRYCRGTLTRTLTVTAIATVLAGCLSILPPKDPSLSSGKNVIILVPGYYGTSLVEKEGGSRVHVTFSNVVFGHTHLGINDKDLGIPRSRSIEAGNVLGKFVVLPTIWEHEAYGTLFHHLDSEFSSQVFPFSYDWRRSNTESADKLSEFVMELKRQGAKKIAIVASSNGGMVVSYLLRSGFGREWGGAEYIEAVVLLGTPFRGTQLAFYNVHHGVTLGLSNKPLRAEVMSTFPSLYELIPYNDEQYLNMDPFNSQNWLRHKWGLFSVDARLSQDVLKARSDYTEKHIHKGREFSKRLLSSPQQNVTRRRPMLVVRGLGHDTPSQASWENGRWIFKKKELMSDGDGTVSLESGIPPLAFQAAFALEDYLLKVGHSEMAADHRVGDRIIDFLNTHGF